MATATRIEIRRIEAVERSARDLAAILSRLDTIEAKLDDLVQSLSFAPVTEHEHHDRSANRAK